MLRPNQISLSSRLGFIGLGHLGSPIARRLVAAGFPMVVYGLDDTKAVKVAEFAADVAWSPGRLAREVDVVLSCLPDERAFEAVYIGKDNVLRIARACTRVIEHSMISPATSRWMNCCPNLRDV